MNEIWKNILGYEGYYQVSNLGNVKSLNRIEKCGRMIRKRKGKLLVPSFDKDRYLHVGLCKNGKIKTLRIHRLVLSTFSNSYRKDIINHRDGCKQNNRLCNLEWSSPLENSRHATSHGFLPFGEKHYKAKLNKDDVTQIKLMFLSGKSLKDISEMFCVNICTINDIHKGRSWKSHVLV